MRVLKETKNLSAVGPYSLAIEKNGTLFMSGQVGIDKNFKLVDGGIEKEFELIMKNVSEVLEEFSYTLQDIVQIKNYLADLSDFGKVNELYKKFFTEPYPVRTTFQVAGIPLNANIEIEVTAVKES